MDNRYIPMDRRLLLDQYLRQLLLNRTFVRAETTTVQAQIMSQSFIESSLSSTGVFEGILPIIIAVVGFGSMHVPIRKFAVHDGVFVQWAMSCAILCTGFMISILDGFPEFYPLAALGGCLWTIANTLSQRVISGLGLAVGILLWMSTNCIIGWSIGRFGLFGVRQKPIENDFLNFIGLVALLFGSFCIAFVRKVPREEAKVVEEKAPPFRIDIASLQNDEYIFRQRSPSVPSKVTLTDIRPQKQRFACLRRNSERIICIILALISGLFYCLTLVPVFYMEENAAQFPDAPRTGVPYIFSHYFGIFMCSSVIFIVYSAVRRNRPLINPQVVLPSFLGGTIWAIAMLGLIISNDLNGQTITYPLTTTMPGLLASAWSVFYFKEINTKRNYMFLLVAFVFIGTGAILVLLSKVRF